MKSQAKEENKTRKSKISFTEVQEDARAKLDITCEAHDKQMKQVGKSERGLSEYYCEDGCKAEIGIGRVKKVIEDDGYGFIYTGGDDIFFHFSELNGADPVERGDLLKFKIGYNPFSDKLQAVQIESLNGLRR